MPCGHKIWLLWTSRGTEQELLPVQFSQHKRWPRPRLPKALCARRQRRKRNELLGTRACWSLRQLTHLLDRALVEAILLDDLPVVQHVELLCGVLAGKEHDGLLATRMLCEEVRHVVHLV